MIVMSPRGTSGMDTGWNMAYKGKFDELLKEKDRAVVEK